MQKPKDAPAASAPKGHRGRFVGLVAVAKGHYQVELIETVGGAIVHREVLAKGRGGVYQGKNVEGAQLPVALAELDIAISKRIREATDLWQS